MIAIQSFNYNSYLLCGDEGLRMVVWIFIVWERVGNYGWIPKNISPQGIALMRFELVYNQWGSFEWRILIISGMWSDHVIVPKLSS